MFAHGVFAFTLWPVLTSRVVCDPDLQGDIPTSAGQAASSSAALSYGGRGRHNQQLLQPDTHTCKYKATSTCFVWTAGMYKTIWSGMAQAAV